MDEGWGWAVGSGVEIILAGHMTLITPGGVAMGPAASGGFDGLQQSPRRLA